MSKFTFEATARGYQIFRDGAPYTFGIAEQGETPEQVEESARAHCKSLAAKPPKLIPESVLGKAARIMLED